MSALKFRVLRRENLAQCVLEGVPLPNMDMDTLQACAHACGIDIPTVELSRDNLLMLLGALLAAQPESEMAAVGGILPKWGSIKEEVRGLLLLGIRRESCLSESTAAALNVINQPQVVERYKKFGNRWTMPEAARDSTTQQLELARSRLGDNAGHSMGDWLHSLAEALEEPPSASAWYKSKVVVAIVMVAVLFVVVHLVLLARVISKVHTADPRVLIYPVAGLSVSALVGGLAVGINKLSERPDKPKGI